MTFRPRPPAFPVAAAPADGTDPPCSGTRRRWLRLAPVCVAFPALLTGVPVAARGLRPTPAQSEGPFYPDQSLADADADLLRNGNLRADGGEPARVHGTVVDVDGRPVRGAVVEIWQCDHRGLYRHSQSSGDRPMAFQGFGKAVVDADGSWRFRTIRPVPYPGRPPHIHLKVRLGSRELLTTQLYVRGERANARDGLLARLDADARAQLEVDFRPSPDGLVAMFPVVVRA